MVDSRTEFVIELAGKPRNFHVDFLINRCIGISWKPDGIVIWFQLISIGKKSKDIPN